jgi:hypothetical protein
VALTIAIHPKRAMLCGGKDQDSTDFPALLAGHRQAIAEALTLCGKADC